MSIERQKPADVARRLGERRDQGRASQGKRSDAWCRETFTLPREEARATARAFFDRFPKAAYMSDIESWRELADGQIEFTMRRLPTAD